MKNTLFLRLKNSQNIIERNTADLVEKYFPNYEVYWIRFLEPLRSKDGNWRNDTLQNLEEIGMSQYGVLKSLNFINLSKSEVIVGDPFQRYKNVYFHFGLIFDSVKNLARNICMVGDLLDIISLKKRMKISKLSLILEYIKWVLKKYNNCYLRMVNLGKPIFYYPHRDRNFISVLLPKFLRKEYNKFVTNIMNYRNFYIHTPGVDIVITLPNNKQFAIKNEYLYQYRHWSHIRLSLSENPNHFDDPKIIVEKDLNGTLILLDQVWYHFIDIMDEISNHPKYAEFTFNYVRKNAL
ncbi:MAG: hypothetical protein ACFE9R_01975 [Candidatus Hermodarchaeota archaeon]